MILIAGSDDVISLSLMTNYEDFLVQSGSAISARLVDKKNRFNVIAHGKVENIEGTSVWDDELFHWDVSYYDDGSWETSTILIRFPENMMSNITQDMDVDMFVQIESQDGQIRTWIDQDVRLLIASCF